MRCSVLLVMLAVCCVTVRAQTATVNLYGIRGYSVPKGMWSGTAKLTWVGYTSDWRHKWRISTAAASGAEVRILGSYAEGGSRYWSAPDWSNGPFQVQAELSAVYNGSNYGMDSGSYLKTVTLTTENNGYKVTLSLRNLREYPCTYEVWQNGTKVGGVDLQPGEGLIQTFVVPTNDPVEVYEKLEGITNDGDAWVQLEGAVTLTKVSEKTPSYDGYTPGPYEPSSSAPSKLPVNPDAVGPTHASGSVWTDKTEDQGKLADADTFREGVDKIVKGLARIEAKTGGGSGGSTDVSGIESRIDTTNAKLDSANEKLDTIAEKLGGDTTYDNNAMLNAALAAAANVQPYDGLKWNGAQPAISFGGGSDALNLGSLKVGTETVHFRLFGSSIAGQGLFWSLLRPVLLAGMCIAFLQAVSGHVTRYAAALPQVAAQETNMGPENLVPGVPQAKTWGVAVAAVATIFAGVAALVALADTMVTYYGGGIGTIFAGFSQPAGSVIGALDTFVPIGPGVAFWLMEAGAPYAMTPLFLATAAVLRFLKT